jgi:hypothetical protein
MLTCLCFGHQTLTLYAFILYLTLPDCLPHLSRFLTSPYRTRGSHVLDALDYLLGPLTHVTGDAVRGALDDEDRNSVVVETAVTMSFRVDNANIRDANGKCRDATGADAAATGRRRGVGSASGGGVVWWWWCFTHTSR